MTALAHLTPVQGAIDVLDATCWSCGVLVALVQCTYLEGPERTGTCYVRPERGMVARPLAIEGLPTYGPSSGRRRSHGRPERALAPDRARWEAGTPGRRKVPAPVIVYCPGCGARNRVQKT